MKLTIIKTEFQLSIVSITLYSALMVMLISLGFWQLDRSEQKRIYISKQQLSANKAAIELSSQLDLNTARYRKTEITGHYLNSQQYLIDNQIVNGRVGYYVMTPFQIKANKQYVLVNRGWVALNKDRRKLPKIGVDESERTITGRINQFPSVGIRLAGAEIPTDTWPSVVQVVDINILSEKSGYAFYPFQIELNKEMSSGYNREWKNKSIMPPEKHTAYAVQWFGLAITLTLLFFAFSRKTK